MLNEALEPLVIGQEDHTALVWGCEDCAWAHDGSDTTLDRPEPLCLVDRSDRITRGMFASQHGDWCDFGTETYEDCDCEREEFSTVQCALCGTWSAGTRYAFTWWFTQSELDQHEMDLQRWIARMRIGN